MQWLLSTAAFRGQNTYREPMVHTVVTRALRQGHSSWKHASLLGTSCVSSRGTVSVVLAWSLPNLQSVPHRNADQSRNLVSFCGLDGSVGFRRLGDC